MITSWIIQITPFQAQETYTIIFDYNFAFSQSISVICLSNTASYWDNGVDICTLEEYVQLCQKLQVLSNRSFRIKGKINTYGILSSILQLPYFVGTFCNYLKQTVAAAVYELVCSQLSWYLSPLYIPKICTRLCLEKLICGISNSVFSVTWASNYSFFFHSNETSVYFFFAFCTLTSNFVRDLV